MGDNMLEGINDPRDLRRHKPADLEQVVEDRAPLRVILAHPRGFCAGVVRAIEIVERTLSAMRAAGETFAPTSVAQALAIHNIARERALALLE